MRQERVSGLTVRITGGVDGRGGGDGPTVVLLHGFGAPGDDLVPLWPLLEASRGTRFVFPEGPLPIPLGLDGARAWWMIDMAGLNRDMAAGRPRDFSREVPRGLEQARERVLTLLEELDHRLHVDSRRLVIGGFSQGAMLACDVVLRTERPIAGLVLLSGTLIARDDWAPLMPNRRGLMVFQSHGREDPLLPFFLAERLRDLLSESGLSVEWADFHGGHEIPEDVLSRLGTFLRTVLKT